MALVLAENYWKQLKHIQNDYLREITKITTPKNGFFEIDLDKREIIPPAEYRDFLGVEHEHLAETIYFEVDRFFDDVDLTTTNIIIEYVNDNGDARIFPAVLQDWTSNPGRIRFAWLLGHEATKVAGNLKFSVRFYSVDYNNHIFTYSLLTQPAIGKIMPGQQDEDGNSINAFENYDYSSEVITALEQKILESRIRWIDV